MSNRQLRTTYFGVLDVADGGIALMDGGIHGVQGHAMRIARGGAAQWERRVDSMQPSGFPARGSVILGADEVAWLDQALARARRLALAGTTRFFPAGPPIPPRWVWAIAARQDHESLLLEGGAVSPGAAPPELGPLLSWLRERVDAAATRIP